MAFFFSIALNKLNVSVAIVDLQYHALGRGYLPHPETLNQAQNRYAGAKLASRQFVRRKGHIFGPPRCLQA
jgi:hypothetical protein